MWHKFSSKHKQRDANVDTVLSNEELKTLFTGNKIHRRLLSQRHIDVATVDSDSDRTIPITLESSNSIFFKTDKISYRICCCYVLYVSM